MIDPASRQVQLAILRGHLRLMEKGMKHSTLTQRRALSLVGAHLGKTYRRGQLAEAIADITSYLESKK